MSKEQRSESAVSHSEYIKEEEMAEENEAPKRVSRRQFVKGAAVGGAGVAAAGVLASCAPAATPAPAPTCPPTPTCPPAEECAPCAVPGVPETWDMETDVVVVGSGTGLAGALAAAVAGAKVIVLEKMAAAGGTTGISGGVIWIPNNSVMKAEGIEDSRENALTYLRLVAQGQADDEIIEAFADRGPEMADFVAANSPIVWGVSTIMGNGAEYHPEWPGAVYPVGRSLDPVSDVVGFKGPVLIQGLLDGCEAKGGEVLLESPAKRLITRLLPDGVQEVLGVVAESGGETINIKANKGVILAAGGIDWNFDMKKHFLRGPTPYTCGVPGDNGDGVLMAMAVGADLRNMNECWGFPVYKEEAEAKLAQKVPAALIAEFEAPSAGAIMVNRYGERFCNEASDYDSIWRSFFAWENWGALRYRNLPAYTIFDNKVRTNATIGGATADKPLPAWVKQADTLKGLAEALGVDPDGLEKTVSEFNENAKQGKDPQFHRGESYHDTAAAIVVEAMLAPLEESPFYGAEVAAGDIGTCGGARVNKNAQVLNPFGEVIPRLYCAGNNSGVGGPGASYGGGGGTVGPGMVFAYIAGQHVVTLDPWE